MHQETTALLTVILAGEVNLVHPPTNCGPSGKGAGQIDSWLGAHEEPERGWDVISFNFGHWDAGNSRAVYQRNLEAVIATAAPSKLALDVGKQTLAADVPDTRARDKHQTIDIGTIRFHKPGRHKIALRRAEPAKWKAVNVWKLELTPAP